MVHKLLLCSTFVFFQWISLSMAGDDIWKRLGEAVKKQAGEQLANAITGKSNCSGERSSARVYGIDFGERGSWAIKTNDGSTYQVKELSCFGGSTEHGRAVDGYLGVARRVRFDRLQQNDVGSSYRLAIDYTDVFEGGASLASRIAAAAANDTFRDSMPRYVDAWILRFEGKSLDGSPWCLSASDNSIRWVTYIP